MRLIAGIILILVGSMHIYEWTVGPEKARETGYNLGLATKMIFRKATRT